MQALDSPTTRSTPQQYSQTARACVAQVIYEDPNKATDAGDHFIWPSSLALANLLNRAPYTVFGHRILELGASHGPNASRPL